MEDQKLPINPKEADVVHRVNSYGDGYFIVKIEDVNNNKYIAFTSGLAVEHLIDAIDKGTIDNLEIKGTVKNHNEFNGVKTTQLNRLAVKLKTAVA